jgi:DNA polymerase I-like protein with 3'-5' exonuclease and polymerase domains
MGGGKLCAQLGLPTERVKANWADGREVDVAGEEGQALLDRFNSRVPHVRALAKMAADKAERLGYITTLLGRRCRFPRHPDTDLIENGHKGLNRLIQGTSADQMKLAMVRADEAGIRLQLQIHDELDLTIWDPSEAEQLAEIMISAVPCNVPVLVDNEHGPNWGDLKGASR